MSKLQSGLKAASRGAASECARPRARLTRLTNPLRFRSSLSSLPTHAITVVSRLSSTLPTRRWRRVDLDLHRDLDLLAGGSAGPFGARRIGPEVENHRSLPDAGGPHQPAARRFHQHAKLSKETAPRSDGGLVWRPPDWPARETGIAPGTAR